LFEIDAQVKFQVKFTKEFESINVPKVVCQQEKLVHGSYTRSASISFKCYRVRIMGVKCHFHLKFPSYNGCKFFKCMKPEYNEKTTDLL